MYTPTSVAVGELGPGGPGSHVEQDAKLSDLQINDLAGDEYYLRITSTCGGKNSYVHVTGIAFSDEALSMGYAGKEYGHAVASSAEEATTSTKYGVGVAFDSLHHNRNNGCTGNDPDRWFCDYGGKCQAFGKGAAGQGKRGFGRGQQANHRLRTGVTMWVKPAEDCGVTRCKKCSDRPVVPGGAQPPGWRRHWRC